MRKWTLLLIGLAFASAAIAGENRFAQFAPPGSGPPIIVDPATGKYLGELSANRYAPNSISNPYGRYGSRFSPDSVNNPYGVYGSRFSPKSAANPYATSPPVIISPYGRYSQPYVWPRR